MTESKVIKILITACLVLFVVGILGIWQRGWLPEGWTFSDDQPDEPHSMTAAFWKLLPEVAGFTGEKTYLLLFQNNLEIRPTGGYLGNFGIAKVKNGRVISLETHDTNIFDGFGQVHTDPPQPIRDYLAVYNWQMRDGNWSPDFPTAAKQVEYFYRLQGGQEEFDAVIAVNASALPALLNLTGPVELGEYNLVFRAEDALYQLEYEVEKGYVQRQLPAGDRKAVFKALIKAVLEELADQPIWEQYEIKDFVLEQLTQKNILLYFKDKELQDIAADLNWDGHVEQNDEANYLMLVEANLGGKKSNYFVDRTVDYLIDSTKSEAKLRVEFTHRGEQKDWFTEDYRCYLQVYLPKGSWLTEVRGVNSQTKFPDELDKTVFANWVVVPVGGTKTVEYTFLLPAGVETESMLIQKQPGVEQVPIQLTLINNHGIFKLDQVITADWEIDWSDTIAF